MRYSQTTSRRSLKSNARSEREPTSPVALTILKRATEPDASPGDLARLAATDAAFAMRVLRLANSAAFGSKHPVSDISHALSMLGTRGLRNVALSFVVSDLTPPGPSGNLALFQSLRRAMLCRLLCETLGAGEPDEFFSVGLLLDIGLSLPSEQSDDDDSAPISILRIPAEHRVIHEQVSGVTAHPIAGAKLARTYGLPESVALAIEHHHDDEPSGDGRSLVAWAAERLAGIFEGGGFDSVPTTVNLVAKTLDLTETVVEAVLEKLPGMVSEASHAFNRDLGEHPDLRQLKEHVHEQLVELNEHYGETIAALKQVLADKERLTHELEELNAILAEQASTDPLTSLPNRRTMETTLTRDLARCTREKLPFAYVMIDIDHFKSFNDTYGHQTGDDVLKVVAEVLAGGARETDLVARFGGEEFCILLPGANEGAANLVARRLRLAIERIRFPQDQATLQITASFGIAVMPAGTSQDAESLISRADKALYQAKQEGRNRVAMG